MIYTWYYIFNLTEFLALNLVSKTYTVILQGIGQEDILVTHGNYVGLTYNGVFLALEMNDENPFEFENYAVYKDENENVWLGFAQAEE